MSSNVVFTSSSSSAILFEYFGCKQEDFETIAGDINERENAPNGKGVSQYHRTPEEIRQAHMYLRNAPKRNDKKTESLPLDTPTDDDKELKPVRRERPLGSKNKNTLEKEAQEAANPSQEKRNRGRPKRSKNK